MLHSMISAYVMVKDKLDRKLFLSRELRHLKQNKDEILKQGEKGYRTRTQDLSIGEEQINLIEKKSNPDADCVLGEIDQFGFLCVDVGPVKLDHTISKEAFQPRKRYRLQLVAKNGCVGVKKDYRGNFWAFINEVKVLHLLGHAGVKVPAVLDIDFERPCLTFSYILGRVLRIELANRSAVLRDLGNPDHPAFMEMSREERRLKYAQTAQKVLYDIIDRNFVQSIFTEMQKVHAVRILWNDIKFGNILIEQRSGMPYLIDFDHARYYPRLGKWLFGKISSRDLTNLRLLFNDER